MHDDQIHSDDDVVRALLEEQLPEWADLPIERVASTGTDNTWERGRGWALSTAVSALSYYATTNPFMADQSRRKLAAVLHG